VGLGRRSPPRHDATKVALATVATHADAAILGRMAKRGLNAKNWFYGFNAHLAERPQHTARVLCGPAAERWLAAEMYGYLAATLPEALTCYGEDGTTDLTVYEASEGDGPSIGVWAGGRVASIEIKLSIAPTLRAASRTTPARSARRCWRTAIAGAR
jgi:hypothetical protein